MSANRNVPAGRKGREQSTFGVSLRQVSEMVHSEKQHMSRGGKRDRPGVITGLHVFHGDVRGFCLGLPKDETSHVKAVRLTRNTGFGSTVLKLHASDIICATLNPGKTFGIRSMSGM